MLHIPESKNRRFGFLWRKSNTHQFQLFQKPFLKINRFHERMGKELTVLWLVFFLLLHSFENHGHISKLVIWIAKNHGHIPHLVILIFENHGHIPKFVIWIFENQWVYAQADKRQIPIPRSKNHPTPVLTPNQCLVVIWLVVNLRLWFFKNSEIKQPPILVLKTPSNNHWSSWNKWRRIGSLIEGYWISFLISWELWLYIWSGYFDFFRIRVICLLYLEVTTISDKHPKLVLTVNYSHPKIVQ